MTLSKNFKNLDKYAKLSIILIILFSIIIFTLTSIHHVSGDACWHISVARFISEEQKIPLNEGLGRDEPFWAPPLFHIITSFVYSVFNSDFFMKFISPLFSVLTLIFTFLIAKKLFNTKIAFYTLIFLAFIPIFIDYSILSYVESTLVFFIILSIYFAINNKIILSSIAAGLGILTKYNTVFIILLLIYIIYKNNKNKNLTIKVSIIAIIPLIIALPWFIRNYILLGNPIWPFLNFIFHGLEKSSYIGMDLWRLFDINLIIYTYLGLFGIPDGNPGNLFFFNIPLLKFSITIWLIGTLMFISPLFFPKKLKCQKSKISEHAQKPQRFLTNKKLILTWIIPFILLFILYVPNVGFSVTRIILPALPAIAMIWAHGFGRLLNSKYRKIISALFIVIICGFIFTEFVKITLAANEWDTYKKDFEWIKSNTNKNVVFMAGGQCLTYNLNRQTLYPLEKNIEKSDYIWINQNFRLDKRSIVSKDILNLIDKNNFKEVYYNDITSTIIYKTK